MMMTDDGITNSKVAFEALTCPEVGGFAGGRRVIALQYATLPRLTLHMCKMNRMHMHTMCM